MFKITRSVTPQPKEGSARTIRIALLTNDNREIQKKYHLQDPLIGPAPEALIEGFKSLAGKVEIHVLSCLQKMPRHSPAKLGENIFFHPLYVSQLGWLRTGYQGCIRAVRRKLSEIRPDIVHGQGTERDCAVCAAFSGRPNVLTIHGHMSRIAELTQAKPLTYYWLAKRLERFCVRKTDGVICLSDYTRRAVAPYAKRTWTVPNAVHPSFFGIVCSPSDSRRVLCVANIHPWKNQTGLIKAAEQLLDTNNLKLVFAGSGESSEPYFQEFRSMVATRPWCEYLGPLGREDLKKQMEQAAVCVLPSFEDNCPMVVLEAAAAGLPIAASAVGGIPDLIENGRTGVLFNPKDFSDIARQVGTLLADKEQAEAMAALAKAQCQERSSCENVALRHLDIYRTVGR